MFMRQVNAAGYMSFRRVLISIFVRYTLYSRRCCASAINIFFYYFYIYFIFIIIMNIIEHFLTKISLLI